MSALLVLTAGCGGDDPSTPESSAAASEPSAAPSDEAGPLPTEYDADTSDVGDDLLGRVRQGTQPGSSPMEVSFLVPSSYSGNIGLSDIESTLDGVTYRLTLEFVPGKTPQEAGAAAGSSNPETDIRAYDIEIDGRPVTVIVATGSSATSRIFLVGDGDSSYALRLDADAPFDEVPPEKVQEVHQAVASMEVEPA